MTRRGSPTECALLEFAEAMGADVLALRDSWTVVHLYPFSSERKRMSTVAFQAAHTYARRLCVCFMGYCMYIFMLDSQI